MLFVLYCRDRNGAGSLRQANRPAHLEWAKRQTGIRMAGPLLDDDEQMIGSLFVIEAEDRSAIEQLHASDPYAKAGLFEHVDIHRFRWLLGDGPAR
ncbi:MAG: YciI family protein [Gammaproteobacteria bacterium]|nr:MAG: YciI family protein [Gammaproteobacteria bacterium]